MPISVQQAERNVQLSVSAACALADRKEGSLADIEAELWTSLLSLGMALVQLFLLRRAGHARDALYEYNGTQFAYRPEEVRTTQLGTRFGKVAFSRGIGRRVGGAREQQRKADLPVDRDLGLGSGFSHGTVMATVKLCTMMAFSSARGVFKDFHEWVPSHRAVTRMIDTIGGKARDFLDANAVPDDDGEVLVIQVDGRGAPMITAREKRRRKRPKRTAGAGGTKRHHARQRRKHYKRPRRKTGDKSKNAKVAFVGVIYTLRRTPDGWEGPINKRLIATFDSHEALFVWLHEHAVKRGYGHKRTYFMADGCDHIWQRQRRFFPDATPCIDWYHVAEKIWEAAACVHPGQKNDDARKCWANEQLTRMRRGKIAQLKQHLADAYAAIPKTGPGHKARRKRLLDVMKYIGEHHHRMRYAELRREDLDIGTGAVEGAVRNLVGMRLDGPGMRWGRDRSELLLQLRCILLNDQWEQFWDYWRTKPISLAPQPVPARTHDAKQQQPLAEAA